MRLAVSSLLLGLTAASCAAPRVNLFGQVAAFSADEYFDHLAAWTRKGEAYEHFESRAFMWATFRSWPLRQAQIAHRIASERLGEADAAALRTTEHRESDEANDFFVAVHTNQWDWNHLEDTRDTALWRLRLVNDQGDSVAPVSVVRLGTADARFTTLYPFYEGFYVGYLVRFPRKAPSGADLLRPGVGRFGLRLAGPQAAIDLEWEVAR